MSAPASPALPTIPLVPSAGPRYSPLYEVHGCELMRNCAFAILLHKLPGSPDKLCGAQALLPLTLTLRNYHFDFFPVWE